MSQKNNITSGFIEELKTYLPLFRDGLNAFEAKPEADDEAEEFHRLVHIVHGAASLVGLNGLSEVAGLAEETFEDVLSGACELTPDLVAALTKVVGVFELFCLDESPAETAMMEALSEAIVGLRRARNLPESGDALVLESLSCLNASEEEGAVDPGECLIPPLEEDEMAPDPFLGADFSPEPSCSESQEPIPEELVAVFYEEAEEHFERMNANLSVLELAVTQPTAMDGVLKENIREVRRAVHTIKGSSALVGMRGLSGWAHHVEDLLDWLFEEALEVEPETVALLLKASDMMVRYVGEPERVDPEEEVAMAVRFDEIVGAHGWKESSEAELGIFDSPEEQEVLPAKGQALNMPFSGIRLGMDRLDDLVNLVSEQMIALSSFDQKLDAFMGVVSELDLFRARLKETSKSLEVGYEVKAIQGAGSPSLPPSLDDGMTQFDALELDRYSEFNLIIRALAESSVDISEIHSQLQHFYSEFDGYMTRHRVLLSELQGKLMQVRMAPMSVLTSRMRRTVREASETLNKNVRLMIRGEEIELDRMIWEKLSDPLLHILRNCVDHGIEGAEERKRIGKPETGVVTVSASREGNQVVLRIRDDGRGLDLEAIGEKAAAFLDRPASALSQQELVNLIFEPGFTTSESISEISGRGIGMDVVKSNVEEIKGQVLVTSFEPGVGTTLTITIPLTLAVARAILFSVSGSTFAIPLGEVEEIMQVEEASISETPFHCVKVGSRVIPLESLSESLGLAPESSAKDPGRFTALKIRPRNEELLFPVDALLGQREIVIKSLGSHLEYVKGISGATILGDGTIIPILNVQELFSSETEGMVPVITTPKEQSPLKGSMEVLVVDDSVSVRRVVSRLMEEQGWQTHTARDGMEALELLSEVKPGLIVLDIEMPRMNGYEFLSARRSKPELKEIPVIMLTSRSTAKYRSKARELGADGYLVKPFSDKVFIDLTHRLTGA